MINISCSSISNSRSVAVPDSTLPNLNTFKNPVFEPVLADPTVLKDPNTNLFYAYGTQDKMDNSGVSLLVPILESADMVQWRLVGTAFQERPNWKKNGGIWAPDINMLNGKYYLYYSLSTWGDPNPGIGLAISDSPKGPFVDQGKLFDSKDIDVPNSIDPFFYAEKGKNYLFWGSFSDHENQGTFAIELTADGRKIINKHKVKIAAGDFEAVTIYKKDSYYYFIGSKGSCCEGANSQYHVLVGRSKNILGPYSDQNGADLKTRGKGTLILSGNELIAGPGHTSKVIKDAAGKEWIYYHAIDKKQGKLANGTNRRMLMLGELMWKDGWPNISNGIPTLNPVKKPTIK